MSKEFKKKLTCTFSGDNKIRFGLLFSGEEVIAKFRAFTCENCYGERTFSGLNVNANDIIRLRDTMYPNEKLTKPTLLRAVYVEHNLKAGDQAPMRLIEDFGFQYIKRLVVQMKPDWPGLEAEINVIKCIQKQNPHPAIQRLRQLRARQLF